MICGRYEIIPIIFTIFKYNNDSFFYGHCNPVTCQDKVFVTLCNVNCLYYNIKMVLWRQVITKPELEKNKNMLSNWQWTLQHLNILSGLSHRHTLFSHMSELLYWSIIDFSVCVCPASWVTGRSGPCAVNQTQRGVKNSFQKSEFALKLTVS